MPASPSKVVPEHARAPQMTVVGPTMGAWGREKYGLKPVKVEALQFLQ